MAKALRIHDKYFKKFISSVKIQKAIAKMAARINKDFKNKRPVFLSVLNGSFLFTADLLKKIKIECELSFIKVSSYSGAASTGKVKTLIGVNENLKGRMVIILEDIVDSGNTLEKVYAELKKHKPKQIKVATLFFKPNAYKKKIRLDYTGMKVSNDFLVGYGLDYNGLGRNLSDIYKLKNKPMLNIVIFGPPGAGKGTQAEKLVEKYQLVHLSTGDIFRANIKGGTELGKLAKSYMDKGDLVPDEVTIRMLESEVGKYKDPKGFIFDGFPRTTAQAEALDKFLAGKNIPVTVTLALEVEVEELTRRIMLRGKKSGRADDQDESIVRNRVKEYNSKTVPLKDYYKKQGKLRSVDGSGNVDEIFVSLCKEIKI
jgi:adenylate kinase